MVTDVRRNVILSLADQTSSGCSERLARETNAFLGDGSKEDDFECHRFRYRNAIQAFSSPSTSSTGPGTSPTSVAGQIQRKYCRMQAQHSPLLTTARRLLLQKLEGGNGSIERGSLYVARSSSKTTAAEGMPAISKKVTA